MITIEFSSDLELYIEPLDDDWLAFYINYRLEDISSDQTIQIEYSNQLLTITQFKEFNSSLISIYLFITNSKSQGYTELLSIKTYMSDQTTLIDIDETSATI